MHFLYQSQLIDILDRLAIQKDIEVFQQSRLADTGGQVLTILIFCILLRRDMTALGQEVPDLLRPYIVGQQVVASLPILGRQHQDVPGHSPLL